MQSLFYLSLAFAAGSLVGVLAWHLASASQLRIRRHRLTPRLRSPREELLEPIPHWLEYSYLGDRERLPLYTREAVAEAKRALRQGFGIVIRVRP